jgi:hypothetical protein
MSLIRLIKEFWNTLEGREEIGSQCYPPMAALVRNTPIASQGVAGLAVFAARRVRDL